MVVPWFSKLYGYCTLSAAQRCSEGEAQGIPSNMYHTRSLDNTHGTIPINVHHSKSIYSWSICTADLYYDTYHHPYQVDIGEWFPHHNQCFTIDTAFSHILGCRRFLEYYRFHTVFPLKYGFIMVQECHITKSWNWSLPRDNWYQGQIQGNILRGEEFHKIVHVQTVTFSIANNIMMNNSLGITEAPSDYLRQRKSALVSLLVRFMR